MRNLHPRAVWVLFVRYSSTTLVFLPLAYSAAYIIRHLYFTNEIFPARRFIIVLVVLIVLGLILTYLWSKLAYRLYHYELTNEGINKEQGVIWKKYVTIPYNRIQNVDIHRGILDRFLGLSDMRIQTAGSSAFGSYGQGLYSEGRLPGLSAQDAEQLRDELIRRAK